MNRKSQTICIALAVLSIAGCMSPRKAVVKGTFLLEAKRSSPPARSDSQVLLSIRPFSIAPAFQKSGLVSRVAENQYEADFYNEYFSSPMQMIAGQTHDWLADSGLFAQVLSPLSSVQPTHLLEGHIASMYMDARDPANPQAVLEITFFLVQQEKRNGTVVFRKTYASTQPMINPAATDYIAAQNTALTDILTKLEKDLAQTLEP